MFGLDLFTTCLIVYVAVSGCVAGVWYEVDPPKRDLYGDLPDDWSMPVAIASIFWGPGLVVVCAMLVLWCLSWIPRLPARLILRWIRRSRLPEARVL